MIGGRKNVVRLSRWTNPIFDETLARESDLNLTVCSVADTGTNPRLALEEAHVYHVPAARDEVPQRWRVTPELLKHCPSLLCVSSAGSGYDTVDVDACTQAGVAVVNQAGGNANSVAEHTFGLMLSVSRRICESNRRLRHERGFSREDVMGSEIGGKVLGIVGIGHVGTRVATLARAFNMTVLAYDPYLTDVQILERGATSVAFNDLLTRSDIISLHCPRTDESTGLIGARQLRQMKQGSLFITTARGGIHDEAALLDALRSGHIGGAGLDVWDHEPPPPDHPLLQLDTVVATFHTAGVTHEARYNVAAMAAEQIVGMMRGARPPRLINPQVWPAYLTRFKAALLR